MSAHSNHRSVAHDGPGSDVIVGVDVVYASVDGADDQFYDAQRVVYRAATGDLSVSPFAGGQPNDQIPLQVTGGGVGVDYMGAHIEFVSGSGDDFIEGPLHIWGGPGDDWLAPLNLDIHSTERPSAYGGSGDDTLVGDIVGGAFWGGAGDDVFLTDGVSDLWGGAGADLFVFQTLQPATIHDLSRHDRINVSALAEGSGAELFDEGYLGVSYSGGVTLLSIDRDGGGDEFQVIARLKGHFTQSFIEGLIV